MEHIVDFFIAYKDQFSGYIDKVKVNNEKTLIKFGTIDNEEISINFFTTGSLDDSIDSYEEKIKCLFNTNEDISALEKEIKSIKIPFNVRFMPYMQISRNDEPLTFALRITINYKTI